MGKQKKIVKMNLITFLLIIIVLAAAVSISTYCLTIYLSKYQDSNAQKVDVADTTLVENVLENEEEIKPKASEEFDYMFLKLENKKENKIYSPLSIKYALKMLEEASNNETKKQITKLLGDKTFTRYTLNSNLSIANSLFVRDSFKTQIKENYINILKSNYDAELKFDTFENAKNLNDWINEKTFGIIPEISSDEDVKELDFALINAIAIDMEWKNKFTNPERGEPVLEYKHEQRMFEANTDWEEKDKKGITVWNVSCVSSDFFDDGKEKLEVSGMNIYASINNYDIINDLGEENIKKTVSEEYSKFAKGEEYDKEHAYGDFPISEDVSDEGINKDLEGFLPTYISELNANYHQAASSTDFSIYVDDEVKVFSKDLKEYNGTTLQYIGIMPTTAELEEFVALVDSEKISNYIKNLKDINCNNFKEGVVTRIYGYIPKFKFEYSLDLMEDLKLCNVTDVFDKEKADLTNMSEKGAYIDKAFHKANIEFTQDGIKAAAVTFVGGLGAGMPFDYFFDVPVEEIDMTFDKPYMFLIIDKETKETFFTGTVYEPLLWEEEPDNMQAY